MIWAVGKTNQILKTESTGRGVVCNIYEYNIYKYNIHDIYINAGHCRLVADGGADG